LSAFVATPRGRAAVLLLTDLPRRAIRGESAVTRSPLALIRLVAPRPMTPSGGRLTGAKGSRTPYRGLGHGVRGSVPADLEAYGATRARRERRCTVAVGSRIGTPAQRPAAARYATGSSSAAR